ncbi:CAP domain-containing protein [Pontibacillus sp. HMF3514]|uniref:CAP domain-containing protein n=1 Tax=Pontibacillus sp. HMF3514 TaxID=2692425 RepID=UPI00131F4CB4|nr:CAP domain-containing protein [Pontibacillus sp. HMF3514]QHE52069.1 hypothetical protein GS400_08540 [Pontibacillus sp. HMF3514]
MRRLKVIMIMSIVVISFYFGFPEIQKGADKQESESPNTQTKPSSTSKKEEAEERKETPSEPKEEYKYDLSGSIYDVIGLSEKEIKNKYGKPDREDQSPYGYTWWIYNHDGVYTQIGVEGGKAVTIYTIGPKISAEPLLTGQPYESVDDIFDISNNVNVEYDNGSYQFKLSQEDVVQRPLIPLGKDVYMQLYFDQFTERLSSIRLFTANVLLVHQPYEVYYRGELPKQPLILKSDWNKIEEGVEQQIFDITNMIRLRFDKSSVSWHDKVASVAFDHSKDMAIHNYFSHISLEGDGLKERLKENKVYYFSAGENIAAQYPDAPSTVEGWLNSEGHREALLNEDYTHLGVGVYRYYYTQNFLQKPK